MSPSPATADHPARILIVDDELHNRRLMEVMLTPEGCHLMTASSGEEALEMIARQPPDLILLDIMMPGLNGYQVAGKLKDNPATQNIPIIMVTAMNDRNAEMLGLSAGAEVFLTKPVNRGELCMRVRNLLRAKVYDDYHDQYSHRLEGEVGSRTANLIQRTNTLEQQAAVLTEQAALLDLAQDAIVVKDLQSRILFWSRGAERMYGWPSGEAVGKITYDLLKSEFPEPIGNMEATLLRQGQWEGEQVHHKRDGTRVTVSSRWALQRDAGGAPIRVLTIDSDITARKQADAELLLLTKRLSLATAVAKVGVWEWDLASDMLTWDATMFDIYGIPPVVPMPYARWTASVKPEDLPGVEAALRRVIAGKGQGTGEFRILLPEGDVRDVSAVERVVLDERGNVSRVIGVNMDVTARKEAEKALEQSRNDQMRFKDEFLSHVSHELRSPLTAIKQFTAILLGGMAGALTFEQRDYLQIVLKNIRQLQSMIDDLLEVTRLETGKLTVEPESVSVANAVADSADTLRETASARGVHLSCDVPPDLPSAYADPARLRQILIILLDNAVKFTPDGGTVRVQARLLEEDRRFLLLEVSDTGGGISPEITERIFERLYQVAGPAGGSRKGLGLGLYICQELVTRQGGEIRVKSQPHEGSIFSFTLPVFSLSSLLAPLLKNDTWPAESVALITVDIGFPDAWSSGGPQEEWSQEARSLLQRCVLPDLDVILPKRSSGAEGELLFVAAFADEAGASVLANRIRQQFERLIRRKHPEPSLSVSHSMLPPSPREAGASSESLVTSMATSLEEAIKSQLISEVIKQ